MGEYSIRVEGLSKLYRIGLREQMHETLAGAVLSLVKSPVRNFRTLRRLTDINESEAGASDVVWALQDLSLEVCEGEVLGIIGANGAGKSTFLKILAGITEPTSGRAFVRGRVASLLEVGTGFHPELTGRENVYLNGAILGMSRNEIDRKFDEIVAFSGVEKFIDTPVKRFSSGMRVRLAFAIAAHLEPEILLIDEVLAVGDAEFQKKCLGKMNDVARTGRTVLFVSHSMAAVEALTGRGILISKGRIAEDGPTLSVIQKYLSGGLDSGRGGSLDDYRRPGSTRVLTRVRIQDSSQKEADAFRIGDEVNIAVNIDPSCDILQPQIGIGVNNHLGLRMFTVHTRWQGIRVPPPDRMSCLLCRFSNMNLAPGQYFLKITVGNQIEDIDILEHLPGFEIVARDIWGTGFLPKPSEQGVIIQGVEWIIG